MHGQGRQEINITGQFDKMVPRQKTTNAEPGRKTDTDAR